MPIICTHCGRQEARRASTGPLLESYCCSLCGHTFEKVSATVKRAALFAVLTLLADNQEGGPRGGLTATDFSGNGGDPRRLISQLLNGDRS